MSTHNYVITTVAAVTFLFLAVITPAGAQRMRLTTDQAEVVTTISTLFTAARTDDIAKFDTVIAPGFYMYEGGVRFDGNSIMNPIKAMHVGGKRYEWNVTQPDVHVNGNSAWIAYVNKGSITDASGTQKQEWLESAFLERQGGGWRLVFLHTTRVPAAKKHQSR